MKNKIRGIAARYIWTDKNGKRRHGSICWDCVNACPDVEKGIGCSWSILFKPVEGWTAEYRPMVYDGETIESYFVKECPRFVESCTDFALKKRKD